MRSGEKDNDQRHKMSFPGITHEKVRNRGRPLSFRSVLLGTSGRINNSLLSKSRPAKVGDVSSPLLPQLVETGAKFQLSGDSYGNVRGV